MTLAINSLTPRARRLVVQAAAEAASRDQGFVGTEHLLLAIAQDPRGVAGQVLDQLGVRGDVLQRLTTIIDRQAAGEAGHPGDQAVVAFDPSPASNHPLLLLT